LSSSCCRLFESKSSNTLRPAPINQNPCQIRNRHSYHIKLRLSLRFCSFFKGACFRISKIFSSVSFRSFELNKSKISSASYVRIFAPCDTGSGVTYAQKYVIWDNYSAYKYFGINNRAYNNSRNIRHPFCCTSKNSV